MNGNGKNKVRFGPYAADLETQELWKSGVRLKLGGQPFGILTMLLNRPGELVSREELRSALWSSETFVDFNHGLNAAMNKLRDCLNDSAEDPKYIETLPRRGYRFIAQVEIPSTPAPVEVPPPVAVTVGEPLEQISWVETAPMGRIAIPYRWLAVSFLLLLTAIAGVLYLMKHWRSPFDPPEGTSILGNAPRPAISPVFSPDGERIAFKVERDTGHSAGIYVSDLESGELAQITTDAFDMSPTWSPDAQRLAFVRGEPKGPAIYVVPAKGSGAQKLAAINMNPTHAELDWSPDGQSIAFAGSSREGTSRLYVISLTTGDTRPLSEPLDGDRDWGPAYSPDGKRIAFVRRRASDLTENIFVLSLAGGAAQQVSFGGGNIEGPPTWSSDGKWIVYASTQSGESLLWRVPSTGGVMETVPGVGGPSSHPSIPRRGAPLLAYQSVLGDSTIWRMNVSSSGGAKPGLVVISAAGSNEGPQLSPNGRKLAFMSNRGGSMEIWISDPDGSYPLKLTNLGGCGSPRWSPDSRSIVFDSVHSGRPAIYMVSVDGGEPRLLAGGNWENHVPGWSHDGRWIYFASNRDGQDNVWKVRASGGEPIRVTQHNGFSTQESPDGKTLYFSSGRFPLPEIWEMPVGGGPEKIVSPLLRPESWAGWAVTESGFYFLAPGGEGSATLEFVDPKAGTARVVSRMGSNVFWLSASDGGQTVWYNEKQEGQSVILVKKDFH